MRRAGGSILVAALLAPAVLGASASMEGAWTQAGGGPGHPWTALLPSAPLDVLGTGRLFEGGGVEVDGFLAYAEWNGTVFAVAPDASGAGCERSSIVLAPGAAPTRRPIDDCRRPRTLFSSASRGIYVLCPLVMDSSSPLLQARSLATDEVVWSVPAEDLGGTIATSAWFCEALAADDATGDAVVTISEVPDAQAPASGAVSRIARLVKISLDDGAVVWHRALDEATFTTGFQFDPALAGPGFGRPGGPSGGHVRPWGVTMTPTGTVVHASIQAPSVPARAALAWFDADGSLQEARVSQDYASARPAGVERTEHYAPHWGAARGPLVGFAWAGRFMLVNPSDPEPIKDVPFDPVASGDNYAGVVGPAWWEDHLILPLGPSISDVDPSQPERLRWSWTPGPEWDVGAALIAPPADVYAIIAREDPSREGKAQGELVRLALADGAVRSRIRLTVEDAGFGDGRWYVQLLPLDDGRVLLGDEDGHLVWLGEVDPASAPVVQLSNAYPAPGEEFRFELPTAGAASAYVVGFGDTDPVEAGPGETIAHRYATEGVRDVLVTAVYPDGRTATSVSTVRVGEAPPPELNALQTAFSDRYQNLTFGILGLLLTLGGALIALLTRRRRRSKLDALLEELERIREGSAADALEAVRRLELFRAGVLAQLRRGDLDDAQFSVLELRVSRLLQSLRLRLLGPFAGRVSDEFRHMVEAALEDGRVSREEALILHAGLDREARLTAQERQRLVGLIAMWEGKGEGA